jgi:hypothetical protein
MPACLLRIFQVAWAAPVSVRLDPEPVGAADATATVLELLIVIGATLVCVSQPDQCSKPAIASEA